MAKFCCGAILKTGRHQITAAPYSDDFLRGFLGSGPLAIASGSGAEGRNILGTVVVTGMLAATALAIFLIPVLFVLFETIALKLGKATAHDAHHPEILAPPDATEGAH
jgi:hypothetical protein